MDQTNLTEEAVTPAAVNSADAAQGAFAKLGSKKAVERALERAALRELKNRMREQYAEEDAADEAEYARMRAERIAYADGLKAEEWQMNVDREMAFADARSEWVRQHADDAAMRREVRAAQRQARDEAAQTVEPRVIELREERNAANEEYSSAVWQMNVERELSRAEARKQWVEAHARTVEARRAYKAAMKEMRKARAAAKAERQAAEAHERKARIETDNARVAKLHDAMKEQFYVTTLIRDAVKEGSPAEEIEALRVREAELKKVVENLQVQIREERLAEEDARYRAISEAGKARVMEEALIREEWLINKQIATLELRRVRAEEKAAKAAVKSAENAYVASLREERNARVDSAKAAERELYTAHELRIAEMQEQLLVALEAEREELRRVKAAEKASAAAIREAEAAAAKRRREEILEREATDNAKFLEMAKERAYGRSLERDAAIASAQVAYKAMCGDMDENGLK